MKLMDRSGKLYLALIAGVGTVLLILGMLGWYAFRIGAAWQRVFLSLLFGLFAVVALAAFIGLIAISYSLNRYTGFSQVLYKVASAALNGLYQPAIFLGRLFGVEKDRIRASFISLHNQLACQLPVKIQPAKILILAPVCLQMADCVRKVTTNADNCLRCGRCRVGDLLALRDRYGVHLAVATGGTIARKLLKDLRPQAVVAIACERDLVSGMQDARPLLVLGVTNQRPNGPCFNTTVDLQAVELALLHLIRGITLPELHKTAVSGVALEAGKSS